MAIAPDNGEDTLKNGAKCAFVYFILWPFCLGVIARELIESIKEKTNE